MTELPKTPAGKVNRKILREREASANATEQTNAYPEKIALSLVTSEACPECMQCGLADMGAEVIKIENPANDDNSRTFTIPSHSGHAVYFLTVNRNKKSVALDLKAPEGKAAFLTLVANSDVVIENYRVGVMERLGLDYETLKSVRPGIIVASISGYGRDGPNVNVPGYDPVAQAETGLMAMTGDPNAPPTRAGISLVDMMTGLYASNATSAALRHKELTGEGRFIELSLFETGLNMLVNFEHQYLMTGNEPTRAGNGNQVAQPASAPFSAKRMFQCIMSRA